MPAKQKGGRDRPSHSFRHLENVLATPHVGYVTEDLYRTFMAMSWRTLSTKRVAAAVGEGSAAVRSVHEHLTFDRH